MAENRAEFVLALDGDDSAIKAIFNAFKRTVKDSAAELEQTTSNITLFRGLKENLDKASVAVTATTLALNKLQVEVVATKLAGEDIGKDLAKDLAAAEKAANSANKEFAKQETAVAKMAKSLTAAGVNLKSLGTEEIRLATATKQAAAAEQDRQAAALLGIKLSKDQAAEAQRLVAAYNTLRSNGTASLTDLANAHKQLTAKLKETSVGVKETGISADSLGLSLRSALVGAVLPFVGITAAISAVTAAFTASITASRDWRNELAKLSAITNASEADVTALGDGVRALSRELGFDAVEGVKALREILRAGIPQDNALDVLRASADAAKAGLTDIGTAAKLSTTLINGFGVQASQLGKALDIIFNAQKGGGATIAELSAALGEIAPLAKAANIPLEEVVATIQTLIKAGLDAPTAIAQTGKVITKLADPDVAKNLSDIGIQVNGLVGTLTAIGKSGLSLDKVLGLGIGNERSAKAVSALTTEFVKLQAAFDATAKAAESVARANEVLDKTPQERTERFSAAVKDLGRNLGEEFDRAAVLIPTLTKLANSYNDAATRARALRVEFGLSNTNVPTSYAELSRMLAAAGIQLGITTNAQHELNKAFEESKAAAAGSAGALRESIGATLAVVEQQITANKKVIADTSTSLKGLADDLAKQRDASQKSAAQAIADINTRAAAQLAAIDKTRLGEIAAAEQILAIQKKQAADRLAVILQNAAEVQRSLAAEGAARLAIAGKSAAEQKKVEQDITQARIAALAPVRAALETHYAELLGLARTHADNITKIDQERVKVQQDIDDLIRGINREGLSAYDAYQDKVRQIDELTSKARRELAKGDGANLDTVNELANRAKGLIGDIGKQVTDGSRTVVSATEAQSNAIRDYKEVGSLLLDVLARRKTAEQEAGAAAKQAAVDTLPELKKVREETDKLVTSLKDGIALNINVDADKVAADIAKLQEAIAKQKLLADVELNLKDAQAAIDTLAANIKKGVTDGAGELTARIVADVKAAADAAPQLKIKTDEVEVQVADLRTKIATLADIAPKITATVDSNVSEVQAGIDNLKKPTESTHTVHVKTVNEQGAPVSLPEGTGFADGGPVGPVGRGSRAPGTARERWFPVGARALGFAAGGSVPAPRFATAALARALGIPPAAVPAPVPPLLRPRDYPAPPAMRVLGFARGGPVFSKPTWTKVPGQGSGDTVPASLQAGSYVVRRAASRYYGDSLMSRVARGMGAARRYAGGGPAAPVLITKPVWRLFPAQLPVLMRPKRGDQAAPNSSPDSPTWIRNYFAAGGTVTKDEIQRYSEKTFGFDPFATGTPPPPGTGGKGDKKKERKPGDPLGSEESIQPTDPPVSFDSRPIPAELITAVNVITYAREMLNMVGQNNPLLGVLLPDILGGIRAVEANPTNTNAVTDLLKAAETIGSNPYLFGMWGKTTSSTGNFVPTWFIDWLAKRGMVDAGGNVRSTPTSVDVGGFAKKFLDTGFADAGVPSRAQRILGGPKSLDFAKRFFGSFAAGGPSGDTVPAMLTPGEWVIKKPAVRRYGTDFLHAVNTMAIPRNMLANIMLPPMPVSRFADGGQVISSDASRFPSSSSGPNSGITAGQNLTVNINAAAGDILSEANVRRFVLPVFRDMIRKSG